MHAITALIRRTRVTIALWALALAVAAVAAVSTPSEARAATLGTSYYVSFPTPGLCQGNTITMYEPSSVSPWAGDTKIAWYDQLWKWAKGQDGVYRWYKDVAGPYHYASVYGGVVYPAYHDWTIFTINTRGTYAVTTNVYSYGQGLWRLNIDRDLSVFDGFTQYYRSWCKF